MNRWTLGTAAAALLIAAPAQAQNCDKMWSPPGGTGAVAGLRLVAIARNGTVFYAIGTVEFTARTRTPVGNYSPPFWRSPRDAPANQIFSNFPDPPGPRGSVMVLPPLVALVTVYPTGTSPTGRSRGARVHVELQRFGQGLPVQFTTTCSSNDILHGSTGDYDFLIALRPSV